jgi:hypothetical protein
MIESEPVAGQEHRHFVTPVRKRARQGAHGVRQSAGLDIGKHFAGRMDDFHREKGRIGDRPRMKEGRASP